MAQDAMKAAKYAEARAKLAELDALADKSADEAYMIERTRVAVASLSSDEAQLIESLEGVMDATQLSAAERIEFSELLVRTYFNRKNYPKAAGWATRYFGCGGKEASVRRAQVLSYYLNNEFARANSEISADIQAIEKAGSKPTEEQLRLLVSCAKKLEDKTAYASALEKYAAYYPTPK